MKAFITGVTGQTGSYLAEHLINLGYDVYGLVRRSSEPNYSRIHSIIDHERFHVVPGDLTDSPSIFSSLLSIQPDEVYNLAAQSHVWESFKQPQYTLDTIVTGTLNILEGCRQLTKRPKFICHHLPKCMVPTHLLFMTMETVWKSILRIVQNSLN